MAGKIGELNEEEIAQIIAGVYFFFFFINREREGERERRKVCRPWPLRCYKNRRGNETLMWKYGTDVSDRINNYSATCRAAD